MKKFSLMLILIPGIVFSQVTNDEIKNTCRVLAASVNEAILKDQKHLLVAYCNAFDGIAAQYEAPAEFITFFKNVKRNHAANTPPWTFSLNNPPTTSGPLGGFTHKEIEVLDYLREKGAVDKIKISKMLESTNTNSLNKDTQVKDTQLRRNN